MTSTSPGADVRNIVWHPTTIAREERWAAGRLGGVTVWFTGCVLIVAATGAGLTVSVAALLVTVPAVLLTTTEKVDPLSVVVVAGVV